MVLFDDGLNRALQDLLAPAMDQFFVAISDLGNTPLYLAIIAIVYWAYDKRMAVRLAFVLLLTVLVNRILKLGFMSPRPGEAYPDLPRVSETGYGFPSGHVQNATTFWGAIWRESGMKAVGALGIAWVILVSLSRLYLGVHYLGDVLGGVIFGIVVLVAFWMIEPRLTPILKGLSDLQKHLLAVVPAGAAFVAHLAIDPATAADFAQVYAPVIAISTGYLLEVKYVGLGPPRGKDFLALRIVLGFLFVGGVFGALGLLLPDDAVAVFVRLLATAYVVVLAAPWLFMKVEGRLASDTTPS
jgi:membrane-associated phospholipid phosphatase